MSAGMFTFGVVLGGMATGSLFKGDTDAAAMFAVASVMALLGAALLRLAEQQGAL